MVDTYKMKFNRKHGQKLNQPNSLEDIAKLSGIKKSILQKIYNRGVGAFKTNRASVRPSIKNPEAWAMARVYASINPTSKASKSDADLLKKA